MTLDAMRQERTRYDEEIAGVRRAIAEMPKACGVRLNLKIHLSRMASERLKLHQRIRKLEDAEATEKKLKEIYVQISGSRAALPTPFVIGVGGPRFRG